MRNYKIYFLGYFIIRPTVPKVFGRCILKPKALKYNTNNLSVVCNDTPLINGVKLSVTGFPHSGQDGENISCAETSLWVLIEYFSNKYSYFKSVLPSDIMAVLNVKSDERLLPTEGLTAAQISYALKEFGFGTKTYSHDKFNLKEIILTYIESGIPLIAYLNHEDLSHSIVVFGKEKIDNFERIKWTQRERGAIKHFDTTDISRALLVMDDNQSPYKKINFDDPYQDYEDERFRSFIFHSIIVPLYPKIYLEAYQAKELAYNILFDSEIGYEFNNGFVVRFFLASNRSFKMHISQLPDLDIDIKDEIVSTTMPKFIWVMEIYDDKAKYTQEIASAIIIIDATEVNNSNMDSLLLAAYPHRLITFLNNKIVYLPKGLSGYRYFKGNLR
jgi:hypothetical protein